eukprot:1619231-Rhodomonas_salina.1
MQFEMTKAEFEAVQDDYITDTRAQTQQHRHKGTDTATQTHRHRHSNTDTQALAPRCPGGHVQAELESILGLTRSVLLRGVANVAGVPASYVTVVVTENPERRASGNAPYEGQHLCDVRCAMCDVLAWAAGKWAVGGSGVECAASAYRPVYLRCVVLTWVPHRRLLATTVDVETTIKAASA